MQALRVRNTSLLIVRDVVVEYIHMFACCCEGFIRFALGKLTLNFVLYLRGNTEWRYWISSTFSRHESNWNASFKKKETLRKDAIVDIIAFMWLDIFESDISNKVEKS